MAALKYWNPTTGRYEYLTVTGVAEGGTGATRYVHVQSVLATTWTVTHNLNGHPAVSVEDAVGTVLYGTVTYVDNDSLTITFARSATGRANCI